MSDSEDITVVAVDLSINQSGSGASGGAKKCTPIPSQAAVFPVPFGHISYTPSLPQAMGPLWEFPTEWWYYAGWAEDENGSRYTILILTARVKESAVIMYGIGQAAPLGAPSTDFQFQTNFGGGSGEFPSPTYQSWSTNATASTLSGNTLTMKCSLVQGSGALGLKGASYNIQFSDSSKGVLKKKKIINLSLSLKDTFGMVLEGSSGAFNSFKEGGTDSFEYAMPSMQIQSGSTITFNGKTAVLRDGSLWLDRQTIGESGGPLPSVFAEMMKSPGKKVSGNQPLYLGNWVIVTLNDQTRYVLVFFWPKRPASEQWIVGTMVGYPALKTIGLEYPALLNWSGSSPVVGINVLGERDFDLNLLDPKPNPSSSPHWTSPKSGQTYSTAWQLRIKDNTYTMRALLPDSEVYLGTYFFEGAATLTQPLYINGKKHEVEVGKAFCEQMGYGD